MLRRTCSTSIATSSGRPLLSPPVAPTYARRLIVAPRALPTDFQRAEYVQDIMSAQQIITCRPDQSVDEALQLLVTHKVSGLPVVDINNVVVGVVSDFDLLALETFGRTNHAPGAGFELFPEPDQTWQAFKQVRTVLAKGTGKRVSDVMTPKPLTVRPETNIDDATIILLSKKIRRLPVVDAEGRLLGAISRRDIVMAALKARKQQAAVQV